ncbi:hypothetical protein E4F38_09700 [Burkholderia pseudomallei]|nr:hypothetical protein E4F38_09700 [Burkholderia pseudomallei]
MVTWRLGDLATWRLGDLATWRLGDLATWRLGDLATWRPRRLNGAENAERPERGIETSEGPMFPRGPGAWRASETRRPRATETSGGRSPARAARPGFALSAQAAFARACAARNRFRMPDE